jgi:hypothetical protein
VEAWTHPGWTDFLQDLNVRSRRLDTSLGTLDMAERRPDGQLHLNPGALEAAFESATAGFSIDPYPVLGYSPACLTTELLRNPLVLGPTQAWLLPSGSFLLLSAASPGPTPSAARTLREISRKGIVLWQRDGVRDVVPTDQGTLLLTYTEGGCSELDANHKELWSLKEGAALQRVSEARVLVLYPDHLAEVHSSGRELWSYKAPCLWAHRGDSGDTWVLRADGPRIERVDRSGAARWSVTPADNPDLKSPQWVWDAGEESVAVREPDSLLVVGPDRRTRWKRAMPGLRSVAPTPGGGWIAAYSQGIEELSEAGEPLWSLPAPGALSAQVATSPGMQTVVLGTPYGAREVERSGREWWLYENRGDASGWSRMPPEEAGWKQLTGATLAFFNGDLGLSVPRWELWSTASESSPFWRGTARQYFDLAFATLGAAREAAPKGRIELNAGGEGLGWTRALLSYLRDRELSPGGITISDFPPTPSPSDPKGLLAPLDDLAGRLARLKSLLSSSELSQVPPLAVSQWTLNPPQTRTAATDAGKAAYLTAAQALMGASGLRSTSAYALASTPETPVGWALLPGDGAPPVLTASYHAARLWSLLGPRRLGLSPELEAGGPVGLLATRNNAAEVAVLVWNLEPSRGSADEPRKLELSLNGVSLPGPQWRLRRYLIDPSHGNPLAGPGHEGLEMVESGEVAATKELPLSLELPPYSVQLLLLTEPRLEAHAAFAGTQSRTLTVPAGHPIALDASGSLGVPAFYRWDLGQGGKARGPLADASDGTWLFGPSPTLARGYAKPGRYTITLWASAVESQLPGAQEGGTPVAGAPAVSSDRLEVNVVPDREAPAKPPVLLAGTGGSGNTVYLVWSGLPYRANPDLAGYYVYRSSTKSPEMTRLNAQPLMATGYVDRDLPYGNAYHYAVSAVDRSGNEGPRSAIANVAPYQERRSLPAPVGLAATATASGALRLEWHDVSLAAKARVTGYRVYRKDSAGGDYKLLSPKPTPYTSYLDLEPPPGASYRVTAVALDGNESSPATLGGAPTRPESTGPSPESAPAGEPGAGPAVVPFE